MCVLFTFLFAALGQQSSQTVYSSDLNGRPVSGPTVMTSKSGSTSTVTEYHASVNGGRVPLAATEERVIREDANGRVVERLVRRYDPNGNPGPPERQRLEERNNADGSKSSTTTVYRADVNGRFELAERVVAEGSKSGNTTETKVLVERPTLNGGVEVVERQVRKESQDNAVVKADATTYRKDPTGQFVESVRVVSESRQQNGQVVRNEAQYERADGGLQLASQSVSRTRENPDGTIVREVDLFRNVPGRVASGDTPKLTERQLVEQRKQNGSVVETVSVQRPSVSDPNRLSAPQQISERVCSGKCP